MARLHQSITNLVIGLKWIEALSESLDTGMRVFNEFCQQLVREVVVTLSKALYSWTKFCFK
jgi:hypothetical protein